MIGTICLKFCSGCVTIFRFDAHDALPTSSIQQHRDSLRMIASFTIRRQELIRSLGVQFGNVFRAARRSLVSNEIGAASHRALTTR